MKYWHIILLIVVSTLFLTCMVFLLPDFSSLKQKCTQRGGVFLRISDEQHICIKREAIIQGDSNG